MGDLCNQTSRHPKLDRGTTRGLLLGFANEFIITTSVQVPLQVRKMETTIIDEPDHTTTMSAPAAAYRQSPSVPQNSVCYIQGTSLAPKEWHRIPVIAVRIAVLEINTGNSAGTKAWKELKVPIHLDQHVETMLLLIAG